MNADIDHKPVMNVAIRELAESTRRHGGLWSSMFGGLSGLEGTRIHQYFAKQAHRQYPAHELFSELSLSGLYSAEDLPFHLKVQGRADLITISPSGTLTVIEVKGFRGSSQSLPAEGDPVHWAQAIIYGHLMLKSELETLHSFNRSAVNIELHYLSFDSTESLTLQKSLTSDELSSFFDQTCRDYLTIAAPLFEYRVMRDKLNKEATFPYEKLRDGQKAMMREVIAAIRDTAKLFIVAPTGIGKTMATLYPSIKAQASGLTNQIFYLTPTRSQRKVAEKALDDLTSEGFVVRSITIRAKEQMCLERELFCNTAHCPYAKQYYENRNKALKESFSQQRILPEDVIELGKKHHVCPFELSLEISVGCDVVICDYNYVFNPRVRWSALLDDEKHKYTILVDEAHNLARRSREMFSAIFTRSTLFQLLKSFNNLASLGRVDKNTPDPESSRLGAETRGHARKCVVALERVLRDLDQFSDILTNANQGNSGETLLKELQPFKPMVSENFLATREIPPFFLDDLNTLVQTLGQFFHESTAFDGREKMIISYFDLLFFQRVTERYYDHTYITAWRSFDHDELVCSLITLDASNHLTELYRDKSPVIFFSATMTPISYYTSLLDSDSASEKPEVLVLDSPFDASRRYVLSYEAFSLRYKDRHVSLPAIARFILDAISERSGHYLIFSPSFAYQKMLAGEFERIHTPHTQFLVQPPRMTERQKNAFLDRFRNTSSKNTLIGLTVIGSLFNEGIDLVGEELTGVIVIGTGLPGLSPEREILRQYYDEKSKMGYEYAFMWPGFNRVTQAVGRLIRSENDFGMVLLIDDRYGRPDYRQLLPEAWHTIHLSDREQALGTIREFWKNFD